MAIIDCHSHAFPNLEQYADQLPAGIKDLIGDTVPVIQEKAQSLLSALPISIPQVPIHPKHLADLRKNGPGLLHKGLEYFSSLTLAGPMLLNGTLHHLVEPGIHRLESMLFLLILPVKWECEPLE